MHIPDGYLSPGTCALFYAGMVPLWYIASRKAEKALKARELPLLALGAAFSFVIMMFNMPVPGGSSGHIAGATLVAVAVGPWAASVAMTLTLTLQAFLFGDGGITALGANSFNMAFVMSFTGYYTFKVLSSGTPGQARRFLAPFAAAYLAVMMAALAVALELGVQPIIAHDPSGRPFYAPYPLSVTVPAMLIPHAVFLGPVEGLGTALVVSYLYRHGHEILKPGDKGALRPLWVFIAVLVLLAPIGLIASGTPWGEWGREEISRLTGYLPQGMERLEGVWKGVLPDYGFSGIEGRLGSAVFYVISAALGSAAVVLIIYLWGRIWPR